MMPENIFKIRDKGTGSFWNGDYRWFKFNESGRSWKSREAAERQIAVLFRYGDRFKTSNLTGKLEIVEFAVTENELKTHEIDTLVAFTKLKDCLRKDYPWAANFLEVMRNRGVHEQIEFIFRLKPATNQYRAGREETKEARKALRQLGIKARTYRECQGVFGMMNREQAMRARLTLDVDGVADLAIYRDQISQMP